MEATETIDGRDLRASRPPKIECVAGSFVSSRNTRIADGVRKLRFGGPHRKRQTRAKYQMLVSCGDERKMTESCKMNRYNLISKSIDSSSRNCDSLSCKDKDLGTKSKSSVCFLRV